ncbi:hypothetical protein KC19_2G287100 [Ceratodon purpureus]|uniref:Uncharacterized protein n=1 Tax=Ceratodon purpureus TaxID=3225 RepID=A0A8T0J1N1_CERPU|nr:hypothetical protein KC19_2G287100 [Ceratodon purpureus]
MEREGGSVPVPACKALASQQTRRGGGDFPDLSHGGEPSSPSSIGAACLAACLALPCRVGWAPSSILGVPGGACHLSISEGVGQWGRARSDARGGQGARFSPSFNPALSGCLVGNSLSSFFMRFSVGMPNWVCFCLVSLFPGITPALTP